MRYRKDLGRFLVRRGLVGEGVEVGVGRGEFALAVLNEWAGRKLFLVDPWAQQPAAEYEDEHNLPDAGHEQTFGETINRLRRHEGRYTIMRSLSREASGQFEDESLDFVHIDANHKYGYVRDDLRRWWPKLKVGGLLLGNKYLDAAVDQTVYGVKSAVDEFAAEHGLQVRVTFDDWPTWFFFKPPADRIIPPKKIAVLTAYDERQRYLAEQSSPNKARYCERHGYTFIEQTTGFPKDRTAVWGKILFVKQHLPGYDWIFWTDTDSLIMNQAIRIENLIDHDCDVVICHEDLGLGVYNINAGQILFKNTPWTMEFLNQVWDQTWALKDAHQEQRAIIHLLWSSDLSDHVQMVSQKRFNSYPENYTKGDFLIHFPDQPPEIRLRLMRRYGQFAE